MLQERKAKRGWGGGVGSETRERSRGSEVGRDPSWQQTVHVMGEEEKLNPSGPRSNPLSARRSGWKGAELILALVSDIGGGGGAGAGFLRQFVFSLPWKKGQILSFWVWKYSARSKALVRGSQGHTGHGVWFLVVSARVNPTYWWALDFFLHLCVLASPALPARLFFFLFCLVSCRLAVFRFPDGVATRNSWQRKKLRLAANQVPVACHRPLLSEIKSTLWPQTSAPAGLIPYPRLCCASAWIFHGTYIYLSFWSKSVLGFFCWIYCVFDEIASWMSVRVCFTQESKTILLFECFLFFFYLFEPSWAGQFLKKYIFSGNFWLWFHGKTMDK